MLLKIVKYNSWKIPKYSEVFSQIEDEAEYEVFLPEKSIDILSSCIPKKPLFDCDIQNTYISVIMNN